MTILIILILLGIISKFAYKSNKHTKWFNKLQPGDKILVNIYSRYCECSREAEVTKATDGKCIEANILPEVTEKCCLCAHLNSMEIGDVTCWYNVSSFKKNDVSPIKSI